MLESTVEIKGFIQCFEKCIKVFHYFEVIVVLNGLCFFNYNNPQRLHCMGYDFIRNS